MLAAARLTSIGNGSHCIIPHSKIILVPVVLPPYLIPLFPVHYTSLLEYLTFSLLCEKIGAEVMKGARGCTGK